MTDKGTGPGRLAGKAAVVLGAGTPAGAGGRSGVGAAIALRLASDGASVLAVDPEPGTADATARRADGGGGGALEALTAGSATQADAEEIMAECRRRFGRVDVLCTDVHQGLVGGSLDTPLERWTEVLDANVKTVFLAVRAVLPAMIEGGGGSIVAVTSNAGSAFTGLYSLPYSAAMAAVNQFCRLTAVDHAEQGVRCNVLVRGYIDDARLYHELAPLYGGDPDRARAEHAALVPGGRLGRPEEVAAVAAFLATDEAHYISGTLLPVDGGLSAQSLPPALWRHHQIAPG